MKLSPHSQPPLTAQTCAYHWSRDVDKLITTVLGPVAPSELGVIDAHTHVWIELVIGGADDAPVLNDDAMIMAGLVVYRESGGSALVDCQPATVGRTAMYYGVWHRRAVYT